MTFWGTMTGKKWLKDFLVQCRQEQHKILVITGGLDMTVLRDPRFGIPSHEIVKVSSPEKLSDLDVTQENRIILMKTLICEVQINTEMGLEFTRDFCRKHKYTLLYAPYSLTISDIVHLKEEALAEEGDDWITDIKHSIAAAVSKGILNCYNALLQAFDSLEGQRPDILPSANDCMQQYNDSVRYLPSFDQIRRWFFSRKNMMINNPVQYQDAWIILWSAGFAGMINHQWELSPALLEGPGLVSEKMHRVIEANHINIPPIYMAWVYYCERKYRLREEESGGLIIRYPVDICRELRASDGVDSLDLQLSQEVRDLRNWLQHGENYDRSVYQNDYMCHRTCRTIIRKLTRSGRER